MGDSIPTLPVVRQPFAGYPVDFVRTEDGRMWATSNVVAVLLGYSSNKPLLSLARRYKGDLAGQWVDVPVVSTHGARWKGWKQRKRTRAFSPRGVAVLALLSRTPVGLVVRARVLDALDARRLARPEPHREKAIDAMQDVLCDAAGAIEALQAKGDAGALASDLVSGLDELAATTEVYRTGSIKGAALARAIAGPRDAAQELTTEQRARSFVRALAAGDRARERAAGGR